MRYTKKQREEVKGTLKKWDQYQNLSDPVQLTSHLKLVTRNLGEFNFEKCW